MLHICNFCCDFRNDCPSYEYLDKGKNIYCFQNIKTAFLINSHIKS